MKVGRNECGDELMKDSSGEPPRGTHAHTNANMQRTSSGSDSHAKGASRAESFTSENTAGRSGFEGYHVSADEVTGWLYSNSVAVQPPNPCAFAEDFCGVDLCGENGGRNMQTQAKDLPLFSLPRRHGHCNGGQSGTWGGTSGCSRGLEHCPRACIASSSLAILVQ